ncbi:conserved hypothetical protein [Sporisorium reilianum SRZ2]|uniref:DUF202 domain-containing protein n=1 Tax=Sporisorium reilianum (strain SRZ2) TaxID=999809 RepID=E6ZZP1_SPORE|nr:conserved hypothetical protein [Sporisorium reilianum SRZ2]
MTVPESSVLPPQAHVVKLSQRDLLDYRAVQRTFDGAYARTALGQLCYATVILRLFQPKFFYVGLVYAILAMAFIPVAILRHRMAVSNAKRFLAMEAVHSHDASSPTQDPAHANTAPTEHPDQIVALGRDAAQRESAAETSSDQAPAPIQTVLRESFVTAGSIVAGATALVGLAEIALLVLILRV